MNAELLTFRKWFDALVLLDGCRLALTCQIRLSDKLGVNMVAAAHAKIERNAQRYPRDEARGNIKKYTEL
jgi:hypothetical protein